MPSFSPIPLIVSTIPTNTLWPNQLLYAEPLSYPDLQPVEDEDDEDSTPSEEIEMPDTSLPVAHWISSFKTDEMKKSKSSSDSESKTDELFYNKKLSSIVGFRNGKPKGLIGLEIECEGTNLFTSPFKYWSCHVDGSLRETKGHPPTEYVLREPLDFPEIKTALKYLDVKLKEAGSSVIQSYRTSVHVHINCQMWSLRQLYCYILLYLIFEEVLVEWSGPERAGNLFCLRAKDSEFYLQMLERTLKESHFKLWREDYRYSACNVASITKFGSLEFRSLRGTVDTSIITDWISILLLLRDKSLEYDNPIEIVEDFTKLGPLPFFRKIFSDARLSRLIESSEGLSGKLWAGLRMMRDVAYAVEWVTPVKKSPEELQREQSQQEESKEVESGQDFYAGQNIVVQGKVHTVQYHTKGNWIVVDYIGQPHYHFSVPENCVMFYVSGVEGLGSVYLKLQVRPIR